MTICKHKSLLLRSGSALLFLAAAVRPQLPLNDWTRIGPWAPLPEQRFCFKMVFDAARSEIVLFGGKSGDSTQHFSDTWAWNGATWTQHNSANTPTARANHAMAYDAARGQVVLFGGGTTGFLNDSWVWNGLTWTQLAPATRPGPRARSAMTYQPGRQRIVLFGGENSVGALRDTWEWDGTSWSQAAPATRPPARLHHAMTLDAGVGQVVLHGGRTAFSNGSELHDTWVWPGPNSTPDWAYQLTPANATPGLRSGQGMAYDASLQSVLMFGEDAVSGTPETWMFDRTVPGWQRMTVLQSPCGRTAFGIEHDSVRQQTVLFGGWRGGNPAPPAFNDTWVFGSPPGATVFAWGSACPAGANALQLAAAPPPQYGVTTNLMLSGILPSEVAVLAVGLSDQYLASQPLPSPLSAFQFNGPGSNCLVLLAPVATNFAWPSGATASWPWAVPSQPALRGTTLLTQGVVLAPSSGAVRLSYAVGLRIGP